MFHRIENLSKLKELAMKDSEYGVECFIALGVARSSKRVSITPDEENGDLYHIYHEIDGSWEDGITEDKLKETLLYKAMEKGNLYQYF